MKDNVKPAAVYVKLAIGEGFTTTVVCSVDVQPLDPITVTVYTPLIACVTFTMEGLSRFELKPLGPLQE